MPPSSAAAGRIPPVARYQRRRAPVAAARRASEPPPLGRGGVLASSKRIVGRARVVLVVGPVSRSGSVFSHSAQLRGRRGRDARGVSRGCGVRLGGKGEALVGGGGGGAGQEQCGGVVVGFVAEVRF